MKIAVTGGHTAPALALIDALPKKDLIFIGRKYTSREERKPSWEYQEVTKRSIPFYHLEAGRFSRYLSKRSLDQFVRIPQGFLAAYRILKKERPDSIVSFGGYLGLPVCLVGFVLGIPYYSHEQTIEPGLTNKILGIFAKKMFVAFPETAKHFQNGKTVVTGNLLRRSIFENKKPVRFPDTLPVVYITGGSLGSHSINEHIRRILPDLLSRANVIHQTGNVQEFNDYYTLLRLRDTLPPKLKKRYVLREHIEDDRIGSIFAAADMVVGRAGANTFSELIALKKPAVLVPLPWSAHNEQQKHADFFVSAGLGEAFDQYRSSESLLELIEKVLKKRKEHMVAFDKLSAHYKRNAVFTVIHEIEKTA